MSTATIPRPLGNRIIVRPNEPEEKIGSIILPDNAKQKPTVGVALAVGPGILLQCGTLAPMSVKEGDRVLFERYAGEKIEVGDEELLIVQETHVLAVID